MEKFFAPISGISTFGTYPICEDVSNIQADMAVLGIPFDMSASRVSGTKMGPQRIRESSSFKNPTIDGCYDFEKDKVFLGSDCKVVDMGNLDIIPADFSRNRKHIEEAIENIVKQNVIPVIIGGDHSVTVPVVSAYKENMVVLHIGAHLDWKEQKGDFYSNINTMAELSKLPNVERVVHAGIRGAENKKYEYEAAMASGDAIYSPKQAEKVGIDGILAEIPEGKKCFVDIDIAGFDCAIALGTARTVPGGLRYEFVNELLEKLSQKTEVIGFDVVEYAPDCDSTGFTENLATVIMINLMGNILAVKKGRR